ncbi:MAG: DUF6603 domain-containing protein [Marmoricola sp.]
MGANVEAGLDVAGHPGGKGGSISLDLFVSAGVELPGLRLAIEKIKLSTGLSLGLDAQGHLRLTASDLTVSGPDGASAELALPGFTGGGYLHHEGDEWSGALAASIGPISVSGFGVLTTDEFSLLLLLAAEFNPAIQLSFGFTLVGVGGLVGINRRPDTDAIQAAVRSGDLSRLLFPRDPVADAPRLLPVLKSVFPQSDGGIIVGPMIKIGWGTPTLCAATIGVLISNEGVIIVGRIAITLPFEDAALIRLEALVLGIINSDGLTIAASLANSNIVGMPIEGDIGLRIRGGSDPLFAFSAGGFHPSFTPPQGMAGMKRIGTEISPGPMLRARLGAYVAVTSNSVQFGADAELTAGIAGFGLQGDFRFDALIVFDPFGFMADLHAHVSVECADFSVCSISLDGHLSGPTPWRISGHASISILFWDVDVDVPELTWGSDHPPPLPPGRPPGPVLAAQLADPANWTVVSRDLPATVRLRNGVAQDSAAVHPLSDLAFRQSAVPLDIQLQRMDGRPLPTPLTLSVAEEGVAASLAFVQAPFPPSQFREMDDQSKLSSSGYAFFDAGFDVGSTGPRVAPNAVGRDATTPETSVLGDDFCSPRFFLEIAAQALTTAPIVPQRSTTVFVKSARNPAEAVITSVTDLQPDTALAKIGHAGVAESVLAQLDVAQAAHLQVSRAFEVGF